MKTISLLLTLTIILFSCKKDDIVKQQRIEKIGYTIKEYRRVRENIRTKQIDSVDLPKDGKFNYLTIVITTSNPSDSLIRGYFYNEGNYNGKIPDYESTLRLCNPYFSNPSDNVCFFPYAKNDINKNDYSAYILFDKQTINGYIYTIKRVYRR